MESRDPGHRSGSADRGEVPFVHVAEGLSLLPRQVAPDHPGRVATHLDGALRYPGHGRAVHPDLKGQVSHNESLGVPGDGAVGSHPDPAGRIHPGPDPRS